MVAFARSFAAPEPGAADQLRILTGSAYEIEKAFMDVTGSVLQAAQARQGLSNAASAPSPSSPTPAFKARL